MTKISLWKQLEKKKISREELPTTLFKKLGEPTTELQTNLCSEIIKKIISYYYPANLGEQNWTIYSLVGWVAEIVHRKYKEGVKKGKSYYTLILGNKEKLQACQENLTKEQWEQIQNLGLLGQNLVFQYRKWFNNGQVIGWHFAQKNKDHENISK